MNSKSSQVKWGHACWITISNLHYLGCLVVSLCLVMGIAYPEEFQIQVTATLVFLMPMSVVDKVRNSKFSNPNADKIINPKFSYPDADTVRNPKFSYPDADKVRNPKFSYPNVDKVRNPNSATCPVLIACFHYLRKDGQNNIEITAINFGKL